MVLMKVALLQLDPLVGDLAENLRQLREAAQQAVAAGAQLLLGTELGFIGYPPRDLLLRAGVAEACEAAVAAFASTLSPEAVALIGLPRREADGSLRNAIALCRNGRIECFFDKRLLPTYDVFDERRHFMPGSGPLCFELDGQRIGVLLCEDLWQATDVPIDRVYLEDPVETLRQADCSLVLVSSASPFVLDKRAQHRSRLSEVARTLDATLVSVNQFGANDELIFDGGSTVVGPDGTLLHEGACWTAQVEVLDLEALEPFEPAEVSSEGELFNALVLGVRDYCQKTGHTDVAIGLSGGIDSALVATIAAAALGPEHVTGYLMPSRHSSVGSLEDARELAQRLGLAAAIEAPIDPLYVAAQSAFTQAFAEPTGITDENLQARLRGLLLMAHANQTGALILTTGNKSELAVGYCTLYGDMCGGVSVLGDVLKTQVYALSRWLNDDYAGAGFQRAPIPVNSIEKPPSAELRPDQQDSDSLPPYEELDHLIRLWVDEEASPETIHSLSTLPAEEVRRFLGLIDRQEYKRHQAPIVLKVSPRSFGRGRPMPIASRWVPASD